MKKLFSLLLLVLCITIVGCGSNNASSDSSNSSTTSENQASTSDKAIEEGKLALAGKEYEKAKNYFKLAKTEDENNVQAKELYELTDNYINLLECMKNKDYTKAQQYLNDINKSSKAPIIEDNLKIITEQLAQVNYNNENNNSKSSSKQQSADKNTENNDKQSTTDNNNKQSTTKESSNNSSNDNKQTNNKIETPSNIEEQKKKGTKSLGEIRTMATGGQFSIAPKTSGAHDEQSVEKQIAEHEKDNVYVCAAGTTFDSPNSTIVKPNLIYKDKLAYTISEIDPVIYNGRGNGYIYYVIDINGGIHRGDELINDIKTGQVIQLDTMEPLGITGHIG